MELLTRLSIRICLDSIPLKLNGNTQIYCFAHNDINIPYIANSVKKFSNIYNVNVLKNKSYMSGVSEYKKVQELYKNKDIDTNLINYNEDWINTKIESEAVIDWLIENNVTNVIICAPVFHIVRAFMTLVSSLIDRNYDKKINVYALSGKFNDWNTETISHQGLNKTTFNNFIQIEIDRIIKYSDKGDIKSPKEIWNYIINRLN